LKSLSIVIMLDEWTKENCFKKAFHLTKRMLSEKNREIRVLKAKIKSLEMRYESKKGNFDIPPQGSTSNQKYRASNQKHRGKTVPKAKIQHPEMEYEPKEGDLVIVIPPKGSKSKYQGRYGVIRSITTCNVGIHFLDGGVQLRLTKKGKPGSYIRKNFIRPLKSLNF